MGLITIHPPVLAAEGDRVKLTYEVTAADDAGGTKSGTLWFSFAERYRDCISSEVCDGPALILLYYGLRRGYDIASEIPMSARLYYTLTWELIPQLTLMNRSAHKAELRMKTITPEWHPTAPAAAMSCGIDSLSTYYQYIGGDIPEGYRLTHLTFYEQGAHHGGGGLTGEEQDRIFRAQLKRVEAFCREVGKELIEVRSNLSEFLDQLLWHEHYEHAHTYKNLGITLLLQKLIRVYYYAGVSNVDRFSFALYDDSAYYEKWMLPNCSTENLSFHSVNTVMSRLEKILYLSERPETYDKVLVCYKDGVNCGRCSKCWRTMLEMEVCGVLDLYRDSFDVDAFRKRKDRYMIEMVSRAHEYELMKQMYQHMKSHGQKIPLRCLVRGNLRRFRRWAAGRCRRFMDRVREIVFRRRESD